MGKEKTWENIRTLATKPCRFMPVASGIVAKSRALADQV